MKWGHLPGRAAAHGKRSDGMVRAEDACWRRHKMCGEAGVSALRFHLCNLLSIVQDYYQLFNNSGDIYQGQLCRTVSCRENGLSVILLHSQAGNEIEGGRNLRGAGTSGCRYLLSQGVAPHSVTRFDMNAQFYLSSSLFSSNSFDLHFYCACWSMRPQNHTGRTRRVFQRQHRTTLRLNVSSARHNRHLRLVQVRTRFKYNND